MNMRIQVSIYVWPAGAVRPVEYRFDKEHKLMAIHGEQPVNAAELSEAKDLFNQLTARIPKAK